MFEMAIQSVDPRFVMSYHNASPSPHQTLSYSVSLPYWDFTIDVKENKTIFDSNMFTAETFGSLAKPKDEFWGFTYKNDKLKDSRIQDGRWAGNLSLANSCSA
jgi:hypothetical protein